MTRWLILCVPVLVCCRQPVFRSRWTQRRAPESYGARFETTRGNFDIQVQRKWSPAAADRMYQLLRHHYLDKALFYRVVPGFVAQFGGADTVANQAWQKHVVGDEPVRKGNTRGTLSFARSGKDSRSNDLYINLADNQRLDTLAYSGVQGFPAFGWVTSGMPVVDSLYGGYSERTLEQLDMMYRDRRQFIRMFPRLDQIRKAYILRRRDRNDPGKPVAAH